MSFVKVELLGISEKETFSPVLAISNPPSSSNTARLLADFLEQRYEQDIEFSKVRWFSISTAGTKCSCPFRRQECID